MIITFNDKVSNLNLSISFFKNTNRFFLPLAMVVYSIIPRESRVTVFAVASVVYTVIVSLWNEKKRISLESAAKETL